MTRLIGKNSVVSGFAALALTIGMANNAQALVLLGTALPQMATLSLWMVPLDTSAGAPHPGGASGVNAVFSAVPSTAPDLTFGTNLIQYTSEFKPNTIQGFFVPGSVINPVFSGLVNTQVGGIVDANTLLVTEGSFASCSPGECWGTLITISGNLSLENGGHVKIEHDDGVSLSFNGLLTGCFAEPGGTHYLSSNSIESCTYSGPSGLVPFDLVYTEGFSGPAKLSFAVPEPSSIALIGLGIFGIAGISRRRRNS